MRLTKHGHACLELVHNDQTLVIDPGGFTEPLDALENVVAVVVTHEHPDHWTPEHLASIRVRFPEAEFFGPEGVAAAGAPVRVVGPGDLVATGHFTLEFFGGTHAVIHESVPSIDNVGVLVNDTFYYPGDSYAVPAGRTIATLAAPIGAPWLKIGDAMDFVLEVAPRTCFGTHDKTLSDIGRGFGHVRLTWATEQGGGTYLPLAPGDSAEV